MLRRQRLISRGLVLKDYSVYFSAEVLGQCAGAAASGLSEAELSALFARGQVVFLGHAFCLVQMLFVNGQSGVSGLVVVKGQGVKRDFAPQGMLQELLPAINECVARAPTASNTTTNIAVLRTFARLEPCVESGQSGWPCRVFCSLFSIFLSPG